MNDVHGGIIIDEVKYLAFTFTFINMVYYALFITVCLTKFLPEQ